MTGVKRQGLIRSDWMDHAICTPDVAWTADFQPDEATLSRLGAVCAVCPVIAECASYALDYRCETGMYAGVWLPSSGVAWGNRDGQRSLGWMHARRALVRKSKALVAT